MTRALILGALLTACRPTTAIGTELRIVTPQADRDAEVWVDGQYVGQIAELGGSLGPVRLAPGTHRVEVRKPGRFPVQRTVTVERKGPTVIEVPAELLEDPP
jgi:hypothetical protein